MLHNFYFYIIVLFFVCSNGFKTTVKFKNHLKTSNLINFPNKNYNNVEFKANQDVAIQSVQTFQDIGLSVGTGGLAYIWLQLWIKLTSNGIVSSVLSRKIIHCSSAPLFLLTWPFYSLSDESKYIAALVPAIQIIRLLSTGLNRIKSESNESLANAISRSGDKKEALQGPLIYAIVLFLSTILFFRNSTIGVIAIMQMSVGDGIADIVGRRWGTIKWPGSKKSYIGSIAFLFGAFISSVLVLLYLSITGSLSLDLVSSELYMKLFLISGLCAIIELLPLGDDNITVPLLAAVLAYFFIEPMIR